MSLERKTQCYHSEHSRLPVEVVFVFEPEATDWNRDSQCPSRIDPDPRIMTEPSVFFTLASVTQSGLSLQWLGTW